MVLASNEWLNNSGDDQKSPEVTSANIEATINNTTGANILRPNFMSSTTTTAAAAAVVAGIGPGSDSETSELGAPVAAPGVVATSSALPTPTDDVNENEQVSATAEEDHKSFTNLLKAMSANSVSDYNITDVTSIQGDLETSRTAVPSAVLELNEGEFENNNRALTAFMDAAYNRPIVGDLDDGLNTLTSNLIGKGPGATTMGTQSVANIFGAQTELSSALNKGDNSAFLNTLGISGNANTAQTAAMNNANNLVSFDKKMSALILGMEASRPTSVLGNAAANNSGGNKNLNNSVSDAVPTAAVTNNGLAKIVLSCEQSSHPFQTRSILLTPNIECKVGRLIAKCKASEANAIFDCKVLSRNHAVLWYSDDGKFWVKDTKSSNGTFINDNKLGNDAAELHYGDIVKFGVEVLENSRKEVHGCIIACVKLYFPDGREAISIDGISQRSQFSGDSRISSEDLHRLNVYMQETSQREKALKSKLCNIQNLLDATRKNSSSCWQAMISEDQLLHRIHSLEKKIQILEKNMPENALKNEIMKLIDDKTAYQHSAKEALRNVYLERCDAMQKLAKLESDFTTSENECKILRDQITCTEESLQNVNDRLRMLEAEYTDYRSETERQQLEAKTELEQRVTDLNEKLQEREQECDSLRRRIAEVLQKRNSRGRNNSQSEEEKLEKQAIENLDAVIGNMDIDDDDDDNDDDDDDNDMVDEDVAVAMKQKEQSLKARDVYDFNGSSDDSGNEKEQKSKTKSDSGGSTIEKWLRKSDLNKNEGSLDIIKAICNSESDSSDEHDAISPGNGAGADNDFHQCYSNLNSKLRSLKKNLKRLEAGLENASNVDIKKEYEETDDNKTNDQEKEHTNGLTKKEEHVSLELMKTTLLMLHEAYEEICDNYMQMRNPSHIKTVKPLETTTASQFQKVIKSDATTTGTHALLPEIGEVDERDSEDDDDDDDDDNEEDIDKSIQGINITKCKYSANQASDTTKTESNVNLLHAKIEELQSELNERESNAQQTLEILQLECDRYRLQIAELSKTNEKLQLENLATNVTAESHTQKSIASTLKAAVNDDVSGDCVSSDSGVSGIDKTTETAMHAVVDASANTTISGSIDIETATTNSAAFEQQMLEELAVINNTAVQREEELITYKERLEQTQNENLQLRGEIQQIQQRQGGNSSSAAMMRIALPVGVAVVGVIVYLIMTYL